MGKVSVKKVDLSQIRYSPNEGEIIQNNADGKFYIYKDGKWMIINMDSSGISMDLYDMNKQIINQLPTITDLESKKNTINLLHEKFNNDFYMLYGKEISYFTLFWMIDPEFFGTEVIECLKNLGNIKAIDLTETQDAVEIWVEYLDEVTCLYLFPYDMGVVKVGE